jgi:hypothetical protein
VSLTAGEQEAATIPRVDIKESIAQCEFESGVTTVYYEASKLFKAAEATTAETKPAEEDDAESDEG